MSTALVAPATGTAINAFESEGSFVSAQRMARALASSSLVPKAYQDNIGDCLIAIELANRTGASVLMVMQNLDIIHGRPSWRSSFLIATVNASGRFSPLRFRFQGVEGADDWGCRAVARGLADGEECLGTLVTIKMAKAEGWYGRNGSKWKTMPELMLTYRAAAFWVRTYAPELSLGMLTSEEAEYLAPRPATHAVSVAAALHAPDRESADGRAVQDAQLVTEPTTPERSGYEADAFLEAVAITTPEGGDATKTQRRDLAGIGETVFGADSDAAAAIRLLSTADNLGKDQAERLIVLGRAADRAMVATADASGELPL
jgi:hypothetical protein